ncbi:hypothetical protein F4560_007092 [Saccharothrix ecbatanensis]|uniref:Uncharacterized protein n=1 Tax=Saccharothrix ecbatanensis TaxID=1105145 RepID=A0A7W9HSU0_9PSEU|nr:hypothetical protein [Saccharothrix ecbatanensis]MBB5807324.1 hypothetical protein [Saccharothrix ecbatanensis]
MTTPPNQPPYGPPQGFPPPQQPGWGSSPQGSPAQGFPAQPPVPPQYQQPGQQSGQQPGQPGFPQDPGYQGQPQYQQPQYQQPGQPGFAQDPGLQGQPQYQPGQPGQPGYQGHYPPGQPAYPQEPAPTKGTSRGAKTLIAAVGLGIVGVVVAGIIASTSAPAGAEVGDCIKVVSSTATSTKVDKIECSSMEATFKVGANLDRSTASCPSGDYAKYSDRGGRRSDGFALCLMLNAAEGECFKQEGTRSADAVKVTCDSSATHKVVKVSEGRSDENECASGEIVFVYSQPATTICLTEE